MKVWMLIYVKSKFELLCLCPSFFLSFFLSLSKVVASYCVFLSLKFFPTFKILNFFILFSELERRKGGGSGWTFVVSTNLGLWLYVVLNRHWWGNCIWRLKCAFLVFWLCFEPNLCCYLRRCPFLFHFLRGK